MFQIGLKKILVIKKIKENCDVDLTTSDLNGKKLLEGFTEKNCKNKSKRV